MLYALRIGGREVNLVYNGQYLKLGIEREISVGKRLRLNTLRSVYDQHSALAGCQRAADLVVEVNVSRRVDKVQNIGLAVFGLVV